MNENEQFLLDKTYDKYQMEISRKDRLENKSLGYYTIIGIFFAAFLVIEPTLIQEKLKGLLFVFNLLLISIYLGLFICSIIVLQKNYKPKNRDEFSSLDNWDVLAKTKSEDFLKLIKENLTAIIKKYEDNNKKIAENLQKINLVCFIQAMLCIIIFIIYLCLYF